MFPKKKLIICIVMSLQMEPTKCMDPKRGIDLLQMELMDTFNYEILKNDKADRVLVWKITKNPEKSALQDYSRGFRAFKTDETYLLLAKESFKRIVVHYWMGTKAAIENKKMVAKYAVTLFTLIHEYCTTELSNTMHEFSLHPNRVSISREQELLVSESFQHTINMMKGIVQVNDAHGQNPQIELEYMSTQFLSKLPNLYVLRGKRNFVTMKKVPIQTGLKWLSRNDICLILETIYDLAELFPINIFCGSETSRKIQRRALEFGQNFEYAYLIPSVNPHILSTIYREYKWKKIIEVLENRHIYKLFEEDHSNDHLKDTDKFINDRSKVVSIHKISNQRSMRQVSSPSINTRIFDNKACYIFDSASVAGLFFILGGRVDVEKRVAAVQIMESYMHSLSCFPIPTPMRIVNDVNLNDNNPLIDLLINFNGWLTKSHIEDSEEVE